MIFLAINVAPPSKLIFANKSGGARGVLAEFECAQRHSAKRDF